MCPLILKNIDGFVRRGCNGTVFFLPNRVAVKLFFKANPPRKDSHVRSIFISEIMAYEIAIINSKLIDLVPRFYGKVDISDVIDKAGNSIAHDYLLDCAYQMEHVNGNFQKIGATGKSLDIHKLFSSYGINYTRDADVLLDDKADILKIIDFAIDEPEF